MGEYPSTCPDRSRDSGHFLSQSAKAPQISMRQAISASVTLQQLPWGKKDRLAHLRAVQKPAWSLVNIPCKLKMHTAAVSNLHYLWLSRLHTLQKHRAAETSG